MYLIFLCSVHCYKFPQELHITLPIIQILSTTIGLRHYLFVKKLLYKITFIIKVLERNIKLSQNFLKQN